MKKLAVLLAVVSIAALAAPALSATNPFMDVPMNHWAYDAIGQLAANNVISGFPDGTFKGQQATTRYEMASGLARSLAIVDWTKASKQDVEMLKRLVVEFKDELESLGVRVDELDERVAVFENRLGGWHIHGTLVLDVIYQKGNDEPMGGSLSKVKFDEARLNFKRTWGENDEYFFHARLRNEGSGTGGAANSDAQSAYMDRFYFQMPFAFDSRLTVGRYLWDDEAAYRMSLPATGSWTGDSALTDWTSTVFMVNKNFALGNAKIGVAHPDKDKIKTEGGDWMLYASANMQFTEQLGFDIGGQLFYGDNAEYFKNGSGKDAKHGPNDVSFSNLWTIFAGLRFDFKDTIGFKGIFYHQKADADVVNSDATAWEKYGYGIHEVRSDGTSATSYIDDANFWKVIIDVKQEALKFTSLWLEYGQVGAGFWAPEGSDAFMPTQSPVFDSFFRGGDQDNSQFLYDVKYWRVALGQEWTDKWATHLFYNGYVVENGKAKSTGGREDAKPAEFGLGIQYKANDATTFGLNYVHVKSDLDEKLDSVSRTDDDIVRFRTAVSF